jgi:hypothetical protein
VGLERCINRFTEKSRSKSSTEYPASSIFGGEMKYIEAGDALCTETGGHKSCRDFFTKGMKNLFFAIIAFTSF